MSSHLDVYPGAVRVPELHINPESSLAAELHNLARSIILECKQDQSYANLETAIFLLHLALEQLSDTQTRRMLTLHHLMIALLMRFNQWGSFHLYKELVKYAFDLFEAGRILLETMQAAFPTALAELRTTAEMESFMHSELSHTQVQYHPTTSESKQSETIEDQEWGEIISLAVSTLLNFCKSFSLSSIETAIHLYRQALELRSSPDSDRAASLFALSEALVLRYHCSNESSDLEEAITLLGAAADMSPPSTPQRYRYMISLFARLCLKFANYHDLTDVFTAFDKLEIAMQEDHDAEQFLTSSMECTDIFRSSGDPIHLDRQIELLRSCLALRPAPHPHRALSLDSLAVSLSQRFQICGRLTDIDEAISLEQEALELIADYQLESGILTGSLYANLAGLFAKRYQETGNAIDIEEGISYQEKALGVLSISDIRYQGLTALGALLIMRFKQEGRIGDLEKSIDAQREALCLIPTSESATYRYHALGNLGSALALRFQQKGQIVDLDSAIVFQRDCLRQMPSHDLQRPMALSSLGIALCNRFEHKFQLADFFQTRLSTLHSKQLGDLQEGIALHREALGLAPPPHSSRSFILTNLALSLQKLFLETAQVAHIEEAITAQNEALDLDGASHPERAASLCYLAGMIHLRYEQTGMIFDLEHAIALYYQAFQLFPVEHPDRLHAKGLGATFMRLYSKTQLSDHLERAVDIFRAGVMCYTSPLLQQLRTSQSWAVFAAEHQHPSASEAFQNAIDLLPRLASLDLTLRERQDVLAECRGLASEACSWAISRGNIEQAVEFLSAGRTVFWSQALRLRTPLDELEDVAPSLAATLRTISSELQHASQRISARTGTHSQLREMEKDAINCRLLDEKRNSTLEQIRQIKGFEDFLLPKPYAKLQQAASNGAVVMLHADKSRCDALVLTKGGAVKHVPFPGLNSWILQWLARLIQEALFSKGIRTAGEVPAANDIWSSSEIRHDLERKGIRVPDSGRSVEDRFKFVLRVLWHCVACPVIDTLELKVLECPRRIWWCPTGDFAFLPIHAAGNYDEDNGNLLSDYAVSSYIPTLETLLRPQVPIPKQFTMLTVVEPEFPGAPLPSAKIELEIIRKHIPEEWLTVLGTRSSPCSVDEVLSALSTSSFTHFACHGLQDVFNPLDSSLFLGGQRLKMSTLMQTPMPNATLAVLNACETAKGDDYMADEAMHVAATMLFAGFRAVVGTMWSIYDEDAPHVADAFYKHLFRKGRESYPDTTNAAHALHRAVKRLRVEQKVAFYRWVPFIHLGI